MKKSHYIIVGVVCYLVFLIINAPASLLHHLIPENTTPRISLGHLDGTLWNGHTSALQIDQHRLTELDWDFKLLNLFTGRLTVSTSAMFQQRPIASDISLSALGTLYLSDTRAEIDGAVMGDLIRLPLGQLTGTFRIALDSASISNDTIPTASGNILWDDASIIVAETARLGNVSIVLSESDSDPLTAVISNTRDADIVISGNARVAENGDFVADIEMTPSSGASRNIQSSLGMFAKKQPNGSYRVSNNGNLKQYGLLQ